MPEPCRAKRHPSPERLPARSCRAPALAGRGRALVVALLAGATLAAGAAVRLPVLLSDHAVLQRGEPIPVWGWADAGEAVRVRWRGHDWRTRADASGRWRIRLPAQAAGGPYTLEVSASNTLRVEDLLVGDVWIASGQSNMEFELADSDGGAAEVAAAAAHPRIREIKVPRTVAFEPREDLAAAAWQPAGPATAGTFSAVAWHFARRLEGELGVPVGIVDSSWGGTHLETWTSRAGLARDADFAEAMARLPRSAAELGALRQAQLEQMLTRWQPGLPALAAEPEGWAAIDHDDHAWPTLNTPGIWEEQGLDGLDGTVLMRREVTLDAAQAAAPATLSLGTIDDRDRTWVNGVSVGGLDDWDKPRRYALPAGLLRPGRNVIAVEVIDDGGDGGFYGDPALLRLELGPTAIPLAGRWRARVLDMLHRTVPDANDMATLLFNGMVSPLTRWPAAGVIWYQGESNVPRAAQYARTLPLMIDDWRRAWGRPALPFYIVQLASFMPLKDNRLDTSAWAELRDAQRQAARLPHAGLAVTIDIGAADDIHPRNKRDVGLRLAGLALHDLHRRPIEARGPEWRAQRIEGKRIVLSFDHVGAGLATRERGAPLRGFAVADAQGRFHAATATIEGRQVIVSSADVPAPKAVRYAWVDNAGEANLVSLDGLPAGPFRTDALPLSTAGVKFTP